MVTARKQLLERAKAARQSKRPTGLPDQWEQPARELVEKVVDTYFRHWHIYKLPGADGERLPHTALLILDFLVCQAMMHEGKTDRAGFYCTAPHMERFLGVKERTQRDHIKRLVDAGYIKHKNFPSEGVAKKRWFKINYKAVKAGLIEAWPMAYAATGKICR